MDDFATGYLAGQDSGGGNSGGNGGGFFGGDGIWAFLLLALLFGWGGGGRGFGGFSGGGGNSCCCSSPCATQADLAAGFNNSAVLNNLNDLKLGQSGLQQTLCQGFNGVNTTVLQGFNGVERGFCDLSHQLSDCCCTTQRAIDGVNYNLASQFCALGNTIQSTTRDIIDNQNANYRGIMDFMVQSKMDALRSENETLRLRASQADQNAVLRAAIDASTAEIIRRTGNECPIPAYVVPNPNCCYGNPLGVGYSYGSNNGCGCGCGCG